MKAIEYEHIIPLGCGIYVHKDVLVATIKRSSKDYETRHFDAYTCSLTMLRDWFKDNGVSHVAMKSIGIRLLFFFMVGVFNQ